jgi:hypothetical protein
LRTAKLAGSPARTTILVAAVRHKLKQDNKLKGEQLRALPVIEAELAAIRRPGSHSA